MPIAIATSYKLTFWNHHLKSQLILLTEYTYTHRRNYHIVSTLQLASFALDRTHNELWLSVPLPTILAAHSLVLSTPLGRGRRTALFPNIVVVYNCILLGFSNGLNGAATMSLIYRRSNILISVWLLNTFDWVGLLDAAQCMGVSWPIDRVHHQG